MNQLPPGGRRHWYEPRRARNVTALMPAEAAAEGALAVTAAVPRPAAPLALFSPWYAYRDAGRAPGGRGSYRYRAPERASTTCCWARGCSTEPE